MLESQIELLVDIGEIHDTRKIDIEIAGFIEVYSVEARAVGIENRVFRFANVKEQQCNKDYKDDENRNEDTASPCRGARMAEFYAGRRGAASNCGGGVHLTVRGSGDSSGDDGGESSVYLPPNQLKELQKQLSSNKVLYSVRGKFKMRVSWGLISIPYTFHWQCELQMGSPPSSSLIARSC
ncbi:hypothetical protein L6452_33135 [Arctium lappa]|uniref:Uncharacterized protein n=1 Tax=Arctium lappa TaxID=4217 RepID=A0ACB8Z749_ARCLA|nr:hypothetical protein L6452_33135 [Arctium lappa]